MTTVKIKSSHPESQGPFVVIDAADFNPELHELLEGETLPPSSIPGELATLTASTASFDIGNEMARIEQGRTELLAARDVLVRRERELDDQAQALAEQKRANDEEAARLAELRTQLEAENQRLVELAAQLAANQGGGIDPATMSKDQLQAALDEKGIKYPAAANKAELLALLTAA